MINIFARILEFIWLFLSIAGIYITIDDAHKHGYVSALKYAGITIIAILMYLWRRKQNKKRFKKN